MSSSHVLDGKVAVVTGGNRGIGQAIADALAAAGATVVIAARDATATAKAVASIAERGDVAVGRELDVMSTASVNALFDGVEQEFGRLDVLVNNSGVHVQAPVATMTDEQWELVLGTNLTGTFRCTRAAGARMCSRGRGKVINVASHFAFKGVTANAAYAASKAAIVSFTRSVAVEWAPYDVQVNALAPGYIATELNADIRADEAQLSRVVRQIPAGRMGMPAELGPWAVLLASPASDFMTGQSIVVDGGQVAR